MASAIGVLQAASLFATTIVLLMTVSYIFKLRKKRCLVEGILKAQGISGPPVSSWLLGNTKELAELRNAARTRKPPHDNSVDHNIHSQIFPFEHKYFKIYGKRFLWWMLGEATITIVEPNLVLEICSTHRKSFEKLGMQREFTKPLFGKGLVMAVGNEWANQRRNLNPAFQMKTLKGMVGAMSKSAEAMLNKWEKTVHLEGGIAEIEVNTMFKMITADIFTECAFGIKNEQTVKYIELVGKLHDQVVTQPFYSIFSVYRFLPTARNRQLRKLNSDIEECVEEIIQERLKTAEVGRDMLGLLLTSTDMSNPKEKEILVDECKTMYFAGHETSTNLLTWAMLLLALNPEWQEKAREEVQRLWDDSLPDADVLPNLKLVSMILLEALRIYPPASQFRRQALEDVQLGSGETSLLVPKGVFVHIYILTMHHDKELWGDDAHEFNPMRFAEGSAVKGCFLPFGAGPRICIGQNFSLIESKVILSTILHRFRWSMSSSYRHVPTQGITVFPKHQMPLIFSKP